MIPYFVHVCPHRLPGIELDQTDEQFPGCKIVALDEFPTEFVLNNGVSDWDNKNALTFKNYGITEPGAYMLKNGEITPISESTVVAALAANSKKAEEKQTA